MCYIRACVKIKLNERLALRASFMSSGLLSSSSGIDESDDVPASSSSSSVDDISRELQRTTLTNTDVSAENMSEVQFKRFVLDALRSNEVALKSLDKRLAALRSNEVALKSLDKRLAAFDAPTCSEQIISFFSNFAEIAVPSLKPKPDFLLVPNEVFGLKSTKMLIPSEYLKLYECLELFSADDDASPILIRGNPGTGKSLFLLYVLSRLLESEKSVAYHNVNHRIFVLYKSKEEVLFYPDANHLAKDINDKVFYLHDAGFHREEILLTPARRTIIVSSPDRQHYHSFETQTHKGVEYLYMPDWSTSSMKRLFAEEWEVREPAYNVIGGIPRMVFRFKTADRAKKFINDKIFSATSLNVLHRDFFSICPGEMPVSHSILHLYCPDDDYTQRAYKYGSDYICQQVLERLTQTALSDKFSLYRRFEADKEFTLAKANIFESAAHDVLCRGGKFHIKTLLPRSSREIAADSETVIKLPDQLKFKKKFNSLSELTELTPSRYYAVPDALNFPVVDAISKSNRKLRGFQMTVAMSHKVETDVLRRHLSKLGAKLKSFELIFVTPADVYAQWNKKQSDDVKLVEKVLCLPIPSS